MTHQSALSRVSVVGLGKVGSAMVGAYASRNFFVVGTDRALALVDKIGRHEAPYEEQDLQRFLRENSERICTVASTEEAVDRTDISFVIVPTPSAPDGSFSLEYVESACGEIGASIRKKSGYHLVVVVSTMLPSDSVERVIPVLERSSGKNVGREFGYAYSPSFIAIGSIIRNILYPDLHLIGEYDQRSGKLLEAFYKCTRLNNAPVERMSIESAEIAKIALNSYVTQKITFANALADLCSRVPNADVDSVTHALGLDRRIGPAYLSGGMGYGGPCFPRDNLAFSQSAGRYGVTLRVAEQVHEYNECIIDNVFDNLFADTPRTSVIAVLGLSYKPNTYLTDEAQGLKMVRRLLKGGFQVIWYDPPPSADQSVTPRQARRVETLDAAVREADVCFVSYPCEEFDALPLLLEGRDRPIIVVDPDRRFRALAGHARVKYLPFGIGAKTSR